MGVLPYATTAALSWPPLCNLIPTDVLLVLVSVFALMPWAGLPPGLTPVLVLWRLRGWVPHPWAAKQRTVPQTVVLVLVSPILIPAVFAAVLLLFWPIHTDYKRYRESTGGQPGGTLSAAASVQGGEKHDWRKWLNTRWVQSFGYRDVTDSNLEILKAAVQDNPVSYLRLSVPRNKGKGRSQRGRGLQESLHKAGETTDILPKRKGERPLMLRGQPHRQIDQKPPSDSDTEWAQLNSALMASVFGTTSEHTDAFTAGVKQMPWLVYPPQRSGCGVFRSVDSLYEGTGAKALRFTPSSFCKCCDDVVDRKGEWAHVHRLDRSWHVLLSPADTAAVLQSGYGEMWPVAALGWVPVGCVLIYAPRNPEEIDVLLRILEASWMYCAHEWEASEQE